MWYFQLASLVENTILFFFCQQSSKTARSKGFEDCCRPARFKDYKTGGYNLSKSHAADNRLISLILLIAIAYSCAVIKGIKIKNLGIQKYLGRIKELKRIPRRHSIFWIGLYGQLWIGGIDFCSDLIVELMRLIPNKLPMHKRGLRAAALIQKAL